MSRRAANCKNPHQSSKKPLRFEQLEGRILLSVDYRAIDGTGNNVDHPDWGSTGVQLQRLTSVEYADGISEPAGADRPNPREISNQIVAQATSILNNRLRTDFTWQWGQFIDHDIGLTESAVPAEPFNIPVPAGDPFFDPEGTGTVVIPLDRSVYAAGTGTSPENPRQQINEITAYIDASNVYGSDPVRAAALRTFVSGQLKTSAGNLLPYNTAGLPNLGGPDPTLFLAGDIRANEQASLTSMHTLWMREHNRIAAEIAARDFAGADPTRPDVDEEIYQRARQLVNAEEQAITYNEFLPALLGADALAPYTGYQPDVNPGIANIFSGALYRVGHTMLSPQILRLDNYGNPIPEGPMPLRDAFFAPYRLTDEGGINPILKGLASQQMQEIDNHIVDAVRNFLFGPPGAGGFDLASLNIQRGRDHGLPDYNQVRVDFGLKPASSFAEITSDAALQAVLESVYSDVNDIDPWVGALAEDHVAGSSVGELLRTVLADQFERLRDGDRFWYERLFSGDELAAIQHTRLADVIRRNTEITNIQDNVFEMPMVLDVKPGDSKNAIALRANRPLTVAVLSTQLASGERIDFDAQSLDVSALSSIRFGDTMLSEPHRASPRQASFADVDGDGDLDLVLEFSFTDMEQLAAFRDGSTAAVLTMSTLSGKVVQATDAVRIVGMRGRGSGEAALVSGADVLAPGIPQAKETQRAAEPRSLEMHHQVESGGAGDPGPQPREPVMSVLRGDEWENVAETTPDSAATSGIDADLLESLAWELVEATN